MFKQFVSICLIMVVCLTGCPKSDKPPSVKTENTWKIDVRTRVLNCMKVESPPALESIEPWDGDYGPGLRLTTTHYEILTTLLDPLMLYRIPPFVESAYYSYNSQLPEPIETGTRFIVYIFADRQQWEQFTKAFAGPQAKLFCKIKAGAYYHNGACVIYNIGRKRTFSALGHEGWHQFNSRLFKYRLPSWLDEGVAMLFEISRQNNGTFLFEPAKNSDRLMALMRTLTDRERIPLRQLVAMNPGEVLATNESDALLTFYSQSYALVRFLREADHSRYMKDYRRLLADGMQGNWPLDESDRTIAEDRNQPRTVGWNRIVGSQLFRHYICEDFEQIEKEYLAFCVKIVKE